MILQMQTIRNTLSRKYKVGQILYSSCLQSGGAQESKLQFRFLDAG